MELFGFWRSSATFRVRVALGIKGLAAHEHVVNLEHGEQHDPAFLARNPMAALPALVVDGHVLTQSLAILEYLEELHPTPALLPADAVGRARVRSLAGAMAADTHPLVVPRVRKYLQGAGGMDDAAWRGWQVQWFGTGLRGFEQRLASEAGTGVWCHGDSVTMADICLASVVAVVRVFKIEIAGIPTVDRIMAQADRHPAFAAAAPLLQAGAPK
jgi:maleylacetoacetate isomerase/maleylpyruvate isomerase